MQDELTTSFLDGDSRPVLGKYVPFARLSYGGMAEVLLAIGRGPVGFDKLAVIKLVRNVNDTGNLEMFLDEARLSSRLSHPNIVSTYDVGEVNGQHFLAMEYLEGQSLHAVLAKTAARGKPLDEGTAAFIAAQALRGLHYAHELADYDGTPLQVVHRDVSPHNLFLTYRGEVKLLDFGIAKATLNFTHTDTGVFKGKVRYMAPEQIGERDIDRRADVFAIGVVLWEMLAGRALYSAKADVASIVTRIAGDDPPLLRTVRGDVSPELEAIVAKALLRNRDARYSSADEMRADIDRALRGRQEGADAALAQTLSEMFAETREVARARIKAFVANVTSTDSSREPLSSSGEVPTLLRAPEALPLLLGEARTSGGTANGATRPSTAPSLASPVLSASGMTLPPQRRASFWPWAVAGAVALAAIVIVLLRKAPSPPPAQAAAPVMSAPQAPATPATMPVHIETAPAGALVEWNGRLARTPTDLDLPAGAQGIRISYEGYEPIDAQIDVLPGQPVARAFALRPKTQALPAVTPPEPHHSSRAAPRRRVPPASQPAATSKIRVLDDDVPEPTTDTAQRPKIRVLDNGTR